MNQIISTLFGITLLKKNPQDLPPELNTLKIIIVSLVLINGFGLAMSGMLTHIMQSIIQIALISGIVFIILKLKSLETRAVQTLSALFGVNIIFSLILLITGFIFPDNNIAEQMSKSPATQQSLSVYFMIFGIVGLWTFVVNAHILRNALSCSFPKGLLWALFLSFSVLLSYMLFSPLIS